MSFSHVRWTVVGAGPAGIAAVGQLLDAHIPPQQIAWIDPEFKVGDFGTAWKQVISNTPVSSFIKFYEAFDAFAFCDAPRPFLIERMKTEGTCPLMLAAQPLKWITQHLQQQVRAMQDKALALTYQPQEGWLLQLASGQNILTQKVILAIGAEAITLPYPHLISIPLKIAVNDMLLNKAVEPSDTIAVFGAYQSARTVQENLMKTKAKRVIHFYRSERSYEQHIASLELPKHVVSYPITAEHLLTHIPQCNKAIYAVGFTRRHIDISGLPSDFSYHHQTGVIAPGIYGLGIAFPEVIPHTMGRPLYKVSALWPFVQYLKKIFPLWQKDVTPIYYNQEFA